MTMLSEIADAVREVQLPLLAVLLLLGAAAKSTGRAAAWGAAVLLPRRLRGPATAATGLLEAVLAVGLLGLTGALGEAARALTAVLFAASVAVLLVVRGRDPDAGCGCFGGLSRAPIGRRTLTRAGLFSVAALATLGVEPAGWQVVAAPGPVHAAVLGVELLLLALLSPELSAVAARSLHREPCELREVSQRRTMARLRSSDVWRTNRPMLLKSEPEDVWRQGCWRFVRYDGMRYGCRVDVVFAVRIGGRRRTAVRAAVVERAGGTVMASFGAVTTRKLLGPPRRLPGPRAAARRDAAARGGGRPDGKPVTAGENGAEPSPGRHRAARKEQDPAAGAPERAVAVRDGGSGRRA